MNEGEELNKVFDEAIASALQNQSTEVSFESDSRQTISNPEIEILFDTAWESVTEGKVFTTKISTDHVDKIAADEAVARIAAQAEMVASRQVFSLKNFRKSAMVRTIQDSTDVKRFLPLPDRIASAFVDMFLWGIVSALLVSFGMPTLTDSSFWFLTMGGIPLVGTLVSFIFVLIFRKTFGEIIWGILPSGSLTSLLSRAALLPLFWLTPLCVINIFRKSPLQDSICGVEVR